MSAETSLEDDATKQWELLHRRFSGQALSITVDQVRSAIDQKTKPVGALGYLELVAAQIALLQNCLTPSVVRGKIVVFGADHGITEEGVSAFPAEVTAQMMANFASGGAAVCVLSAANSVCVEVVDVGVKTDLSHLAGIIHAKVANGTENFLAAPAMTPAQMDSAIAVGHEAVDRALDQGFDCLGLGEMGIGNTTSAATLLALLLELSAAQVTGRGTGIGDSALLNKVSVVQRAVNFHRDENSQSLEVLRRVGGLEIAAMTGAILRASERNLPIIIDGYISTAAAVAAVKQDASARRVLFFSHRSAEPGHVLALDALQAVPLLSLGMRLGEGSAAALAYPLLRAAAEMLTSMSTFTKAGVAGRND